MPRFERGGREFESLRGLQKKLVTNHDWRIVMVDRNFLLSVNWISGALTAVSVVFWLLCGIDFVKEPWAFAVLLIWAETNWRLERMDQTKIKKT